MGNITMPEVEQATHLHNGLDPESLLHIFKTYITPVLLYGMELLLPSSKPLEQLELSLLISPTRSIMNF
jgi:hypothetical protein